MEVGEHEGEVEWSEVGCAGKVVGSVAELVG